MKEQFLNDLRNKLEEREISNVNSIMEKYEKWYDLGLESGLTDDEIQKRLTADYESIIDNDLNEEKSDAKYFVEIDTYNDDLEVSFADLDVATIEFENISVDQYQIENTKNGIKLKKGFSFQNKNVGTVRVSLPEYREIGTFSVGTVSGDFEIDYVKAKSINLKTVSGDFNIEELLANEIALNTVSGDINVDFIKANKVDLSCVSGDISIDSVDAEETNANSVSGDIIIKKATKGVNASSVSGEIVISDRLVDNVTKKVNKEVSKALKNLKGLFRKDDEE